MMEATSNCSPSTALRGTITDIANKASPQQLDTITRIHEQSANKIITTYLLERVEEFRTLCQLREKVSQFTKDRII